MGKGPTWTLHPPIAEHGIERDRQLRLEARHGMRIGVRCHADSRQTGNRCGRPATEWATVCKFHGSRSPQARKTIELRRYEAYQQWNQMGPMERAAHGVWWPPRDTDFAALAKVPPKEHNTARTTEAVAKRKAEALDSWPDRKPLPPSWPPDTRELWGKRPGGSVLLPANVQIQRGYR